MNIKYRLGYTLLLMVFVAISVTVIAMYMVNKNVERDVRFNLTELLNNRVASIKTLYISGHAEDTIAKFLKITNQNYIGTGSTDEFTIVKKEGDSIYFLVNQRNLGYMNLAPILYKDNKSQAVIKALNEKKGFIKDVDYRNKNVYSAFTYIPELKWGITCEIDVDEINQNLIHDFKIILAISLLIAFLSAFIYNIINNKLLNSLQKSEKKYQNFVENIKEVIYEIDNHGVIKYISPTIENILGFTSNEITGRNFLNFVGENAEYFAARLSMLTTKNEIENEYKINTKSGEPKWILFSTNAIIANGKLTGATGTLVDITEKKKVEIELEKSEALYSSIIDASPDVITITDLEGKILLASPKAILMFGYDNIEDFINRPLLDFIDESDQQRASNNILTMFSGELWGAEDYKGVKKDGTLFDMSVNGEFIRDENGHPINLIFITRDITERKALEHELKKSKEHYASILIASPDAIITTDLQGKILLASPSTLDVYGIDKEEDVIGRSMFEFLDESELEKANQNMIRMFNNDIDASIEYIGVKTDGTNINLDVRGNFIKDESGNPVNIVFVARDITEKKKIQTELIKNEEKYRTLVESINDVIYEVTIEGIVKYISPAIESILGFKTDEILGKNIFTFMYEEDIERVSEILTHLDEKNHLFLEYRYKTKDGGIRWVRSSTAPIFENDLLVGGNGVLLDITEEKAAEERINKANRINNVTSHINQAIVRIKGKKELLEEVCKITVSYGDFEMSWVGLVEDSSNDLIKYTSAGDINDYLEKVGGFTIDVSKPKGNGPTATSLRRGIPIAINDISNDVLMQDWKEIALQNNFNSLIALPIKVKDDIIGAFTLYSSLKDFFNEEEIKLLVNITDNIGFALEAIETENERKEAIAALIESEGRYKTFFDDNSSIMLLVDPETGAIIDANPVACNFYGWAKDEFCKMNITDINLISDEEVVYNMQSIKEGDKKQFVVKHILSNCDIKDVEVHSGLMIFDNKNLLFSVIHDITDRRLTEEKLLASEERWRSIIKTSPDGMSITSLDGTLQFVSDNLVKWHGYDSVDEFIGKKAFEFLVPSSVKYAEERLVEMLSGGIKNSATYELLRKDGSTFFVEVSAEFMRNKDGAPEAILLIERDITERLKEQELLIESELKFKSAFDNSALGMAITSLDAKWVKVNESLCAMLGYSEEELTNKPFSDITIEEDRERTMTLFSELLAKKVPYANFEKKYIRKDGEIIIVQIYTAVVCDINNNPIYLITQILDITEKIQAEESLLMSEKKYKTLFFDSPVAYLIIRDGVFIECNKASETIIVGSRADIIGKTPSQISPECQPNGRNSVEYAKELIEETFKTGSSSFEWVHIRTNGETFLANINLVVIEYEGEQVLFTSWKDITEQREAEDRLRKLSSAVEQSPVITYITNINGEIEYVNPKTTEITGYSKDDLIGMNPRIFNSGLNSKDMYSDLFNTVKSGKQWEGEFYNKKKNGEFFYVKAIITPIINEKGSVTNYLAIQNDITIQKQAENEIIELNQNLELKVEERTQELAQTNENLQIEIEERSRISLALNEAFDRLHKIADRIPGVVYQYQLNPDGTSCFPFSSKGIFDIYQVTPEEVETDASTVLSRLHPEDYDAVVASITKSAKDQEIWSHEYRVKFEDGTVRWLQGNAKPQLEPDGSVLWHGFISDITERKQSEIKLKESEKRFSLFMDYVPAAVFIKDSKSRMIYANNTMELALGASKWIGIDTNELFGEEESARIIADDKKTMQLGYQFIKESFYNLDGKLHYYETQKFAIPIDGQAPLIGGVAMDITERTLIENELLKIEQSYQTVVENVNDIIFQTDAEGLWIFLNKSWEVITGFSVEESLGQLFLNYVHPDDRQRNMELFEPLIKREKDYCRHEVRYLTKDGGFRWIEVFAKLGLNDSNEITGTYGTLQDITERRHREEELKQLTTRLSLATHSGGIGVWDYDIENDIFVWDDQMYALYGITSADFSGAYDAWQQGLHPDDKVRGDIEIQMAIRGEKDFDTEFRVVWPDGTIRIIKAQAIVQRNESGKSINLIGTNWDITDQKNAEKVLMESEASHLSMITNISDVIGVMGIDGVMKYKSPNIEKYFGWKPEDLVGFVGWHTVHPDDIERISKEFGELIKVENNAKTVEYRYKCKDGSYKPIELTATNLVNDKIINGVLLNYHDITDRKEAENLLEQTRQNYETFFNTIDDFLWVLDEQGNIIHANSTVKTRLEYPAEELMNKSVLLVHPADRREEAGRIVGEMLRGEAEFCPVPIVTKSNKQIPVETRVKSGFWNGQSVIFGVSKDVSQIQLSEQKFSSAFQANAAMMAISHFKQGMYLDVNTSFTEVMGYTYNEIIGKTNEEYSLFVDPNLREEILEKLNNNIPVRKIEVQMRTKDGIIKTVLMSADIIYIGDMKCLLTVNVDITERKIAEEETKIARLEAEKANIAKSEFLSRMSHELRTPMNSILGFAQILELGELTASQKRGVGHILNSGKHLLELINEVLDISRIESGSLSLSLEPVQIDGIIKEMIDVFQPHTVEKQLSFKYKDSPTNLLYINSDRQRLKQVLLNLINNAIKYNRYEGAIEIKTELLTKKNTKIKNIRILISDNGIGISSENIQKLFVPFERIGAEKTEIEGTGLGLSVVKKLVEAMGGSIGVESVPGEGSTFWIELPSIEGMIEDNFIYETSLNSDQINLDKKGTILYIEDNKPNIALVEQILSSQRPGVNLVSNAYGKNTVKLAIEHKPDVILLDLNLPDIHGSEVIELLKKNETTRNIPVVILTADAMSMQHNKLLKAGAKSYLTKPLDVIAFLNEIDKWMKS